MVEQEQTNATRGRGESTEKREWKTRLSVHVNAEILGSNDKGWFCWMLQKFIG